MKPIVFIDGQEGTTGLQIHQRLAARDDIQLITIDPEKRKDTQERKKLLNQADLVFLCLPDAAAIEAVSLIENPDTRVIDASTAHRVNPAWDYGFPELSAGHRERIQHSKRVANPGCHASGFISVVYPLIASGYLPKDALLTCFSLTGYSGGGKKMIAQYEDACKAESLYSPGVYGVTQKHKHLPEMQKVCGLAAAPVFCPIVDDYYKGMATTVTFHASQFARSGITPEALTEIYQSHYGAGSAGTADSAGTAAGTGTGVVRVGAPASGTIYGGSRAGKDDLVLLTAGNEERITVTALFDNLGKGASGAAVQNMNLMLGFPETTGLSL